MKNLLFPTSSKIVIQTILVLAVVCFSFGTGSMDSALAGSSLDAAACGQQLAEAEARFRSTLAPDGSVPASPEVAAAAQGYIRISKLCYEEIEAQQAAAGLQAETPSFIDEGGVMIDGQAAPAFTVSGSKWGTSLAGTSGGRVTYSFMGNGISFSGEQGGNSGSSVALSSLPGFQACFITEIQTAFAAWQAVANIQLVHVSDSGSAFDAPGAGGDIRIAAHSFDGPSRTLAHAYYPPPNGNSAAGDMHFDSAEPWTCNGIGGIDIGVVALHEIGHSLGLGHEPTDILAVMDPFYNPGLLGLQEDDVNGASVIYGGPVELAAAPTNDNIGSATPISIPFSQTLDTTGAANSGDGPQGQVFCDGRFINKGSKNVWYTYTPASTRNVSFDTIGSTPAPGDTFYDTYIAVWTGPNTGSLSFVGCSDDTANSFQSHLLVRLTGGQNYWIEVAQFNGAAGSNPETPTGGTLRFRAIASGGADTIGVFRPTNGILFLKNTNTSGFADLALNYGIPGDYPVTGDWDGNGTDTIGVYRNGRFLLRNSNTIGFADISFLFGNPGDQPIAGDWNGDGVDTIGLFRPSNGLFILRNSNSAGPADVQFFLGNPGDVGIAGDWDANGTDTTGVFRPSNGIIFLKNTNSTGFADIALNYGIPGDKPVVGDWNNDGRTTIGVNRNGRFFLRDSNTVGFADYIIDLGNPGDMPIAGNWDGIP